MKTNGARFLESLGIPFELREYEVDPEDLSATTVARKIGMPAEQVFKTLVMRGGLDDRSVDVIFGEKKQVVRKSGLLEYFDSTEDLLLLAEVGDGASERCATADGIYSRRRDAFWSPEAVPGVHRRNGDLV